MNGNPQKKTNKTWKVTDGMKILGYDEVDGQQVLEMNLRCFGWFLSPEQAEFIRKVDKRVPDYFALYAVENGEVLSQAGAVTVETQCIHGIEKVGFVWAVCTKPSMARKGLASKLMEEVHARLDADDIRYSFLGTGKSLVAYGLYRGLGYMDFTNLDWGMKACKPMHPPGTDVSFSSSVNENMLMELFTQYSKNLLGFVHRPKNFLQVRKAWSWMALNIAGVFQEASTPIGYVLANREGKVVRIRELCCPKIEDMQRCIEVLETEFEPSHMMFEWIAGSYNVETFVQLGFKHIADSWGTLMVKDLKGKHSVEQVRKSYGVGDGRFHMTSIDEY